MKEKLLEDFIKKNCKKQIYKTLGLKKSLKEKKKLNGSDVIIHLMVGLIKKGLIK